MSATSCASCSRPLTTHRLDPRCKLPLLHLLEQDDVGLGVADGVHRRHRLESAERAAALKAVDLIETAG